MHAHPKAAVTDAQGATGTLETTGVPAGDGEVVVRLGNGERVRIAAERLTRDSEGGYRFEGLFDNLASADLASATEVEGAREVVEEERIPLAEEELHVTKRTRETGRVRISKRVQEHVETIDEPLLQERVEVERVPIDRVIEEPLQIRHEGDTMIIPVVEERVVVQKQLVLKEELHVTRQRTTRQASQEVTLRSEHVEVDRQEGDPQRERAAEERDRTAGTPGGTGYTTES